LLQVSKEKGTASRLFGDVIVGSLSASSGLRKSSDQHMTGSTSLPFIVTANPYETLSGELQFITSYKDPLSQTNQHHSAILTYQGLFVFHHKENQAKSPRLEPPSTPIPTSSLPYD
jgi:hypothetical protein